MVKFDFLDSRQASQTKHLHVGSPASNSTMTARVAQQASQTWLLIDWQASQTWLSAWRAAQTWWPL